MWFFMNGKIKPMTDSCKDLRLILLVIDFGIDFSEVHICGLTVLAVRLRRFVYGEFILPPRE